jgi:hypothetical protein
MGTSFGQERCFEFRFEAHYPIQQPIIGIYRCTDVASLLCHITDAIDSALLLRFKQSDLDAADLALEIFYSME